MIKNLFGSLILIMIVLLFAGCSNTSENIDDPDKVLKEYFELLAKEDYEAAISYYGGSYEELEGYAPNVDPKDKPALYKNYVQVTGGALVRLDEIIKKEEVNSGHYNYVVSFETPDGEIFRNGQQYEYTVKKIDGRFKVMELIPYVA